MSGVTVLDIVVIIGYLFFLAYIGMIGTKKVSSTNDYFVANRGLSGFFLLATVCASVIGGSALLGKGGYAYKSGMVCVAIGMPYMIGMFIFSAFSGKISKIGQKYGFISMSELLGYRFGKAVKMISSLLVIYTSIATVGAQVSAMSTIMSALGGDRISYLTGAIIATIIFTAYTASSGLYGVVYTDVVQFLILIVSVYIMLPIFSIKEVGGMASLIAQTDPSMWKLNLTPDIVTLIVTNFIMTIAGAEFWQRAFAAKDQKAAFRGQFGGTAVYAVTIFITMFIGLCAAILFPTLIQDYGTADYAIPVMIIKILPPGITGIAIAGVVSVMMSSADTYLLVAVQGCITDVYKEFNQELSDKKALMLSRILTVVFAVFAFLVAVYFTSAYDALMFGWVFYSATLGVPCLAALIWKKATTAGMLAGMGAGFCMSVVWNALGSPLGVGATIVGVAANAAMLIIVSLLTYKKHPSKSISMKEE